MNCYRFFFKYTIYRVVCWRVKICLWVSLLWLFHSMHESHIKSNKDETKLHKRVFKRTLVVFIQTCCILTYGLIVKTMKYPFCLHTLFHHLHMKSNTDEEYHYVDHAYVHYIVRRSTEYDLVYVQSEVFFVVYVC